MKKYLVLFFLVLIVSNCNDGDIITFELDFEDTFNYCTEFDDLVFYKTKSDPGESLSLQLSSPSTTIEDLLEVDSDGTLTTNFSLNGSTNVFNYRTYGSDPSNVFCNLIPTNIDIISDSQSDDGSVEITTIMTEDDNDDIPAELEDLNGNGNLDDDDTDGDGLPNYLDEDDDGDNVKTSSENPNYSATNGLTEAQDSDLDGIPDYLDDDDDNDGVLTIDEESDTQDQNPLNDVTDNSFGADYLNDQVSTVVPATAYREHTINQTYEITVTVSDFNFEVLQQDVLDFGTLSGAPSTSRTVTPEFN